MADQKITQLAELEAPQSSDLFEIVDMSGTPTNKKSTLENIANALIDAFVVGLTGNQVVDGVKEFLEFPLTPEEAPTEDYQVANKKYVDDNAGGGGSFIGCRLYKSSGQTIGTSLTPVTFDSESFDTDSMHDNSSNNTRITFNTAGYYQINAVLNSAGNGVSRIQFRLNGTTTLFGVGVGNAGTSANNGTNASMIYYFGAGDYLEMLGWFGTSLTTESGIGGTTFSANKIG